MNVLKPTTKNVKKEKKTKTKSVQISFILNYVIERY